LAVMRMFVCLGHGEILIVKKCCFAAIGLSVGLSRCFVAL